MKSLHRFATKLFSAPLMVLPDVAHHFERALLQRMGFEVASPVLIATPQPVAYRDATDHEPAPVLTAGQIQQQRIDSITEIYGDVAVVTVDGVIDKRVSQSDLECYGGVDLADVDAAIMQLGENPKVKTVVFDFNTPGGSCAGVGETYSRIRALGDFKSRGGAGKETIARVELQCCSAGMYLAAATNHISIAPDATIGSIGVYCALMDQTKWMEEIGLKVNLIKAGEFKAMGAPFKELTVDERAMMQANVDRIYNDFTAAIRQGRGNIAASTMQGQCFSSAEAKKLGLCDTVEMASLDEFIQRI